MHQRLLFIIYTIILLSVFAIACTQLENETETNSHRMRVNPVDSLVSGGDLLPPGYGTPLNNSYEINVMQMACDSLCLLNNLPAIQLVPTDVYVRFLPKDSLEYNSLLALGTELFDYPLTYEFFEEMESFRDPSVPDSLITWQYTVVPYGTFLPDMQHEVLDTCYIPSEEPQRGLPLDFNYRLERLADSIANPYNHVYRNSPAPQRSGVYPCGSVRVTISETENIPVKGVQVRAQYLVKVASVYTNDEGYYQLNKPFIFNPRYSLHFINSRGFSEYGTGLSLEPTWKSFHRHSNEGYNFLIPKSTNTWFSAVVNNAIADYFDECLANGIILPPSDMRLLLLSYSENWSGGAPMLGVMGNLALTLYSANEIMEALAHPFTGNVSAVLGPLLKYLLPDVIIRKDSNEKIVKQCVYHELSHASHYMKVGGGTYWLNVIAHYVQCYLNGEDLYGDGTVNDTFQNAAELTEAWAYANERLLQKELYPGYIPNAGSDTIWFAPSIKSLYRIMSSGMLTRAQVLGQMSNSVTCIDNLKSRLMMEYTSQRYMIGRVFAEEGALAAQTRWRIINTSASTLRLIRRWGSVVDSVLVSRSDTVSFSAMPSANAQFYSLLSTYYYPDEITIRRNSDNALVFYQLNKVTSKPMHHPFFNTAEWEEKDIYILKGDTSLRDYYYTITSLDLP